MTFPGTTTDIPEELLKYQEEGRVVFFCGAGISYDAGIPLFKGLLDRTAKGINHSLTDEEKKLRRDSQFDQLYFRLEQHNGDRLHVRRESIKYLVPDTPVREAGLSKHVSLLKLARGRDGMSRLVTTNYDCLFDEAQAKLSVRVPSFAAPLLPVPKEYKWDGIVYVHGKLDRSPSDANLETLVISSGDFGQAYLTERWASRFVTDLFRDYVVCFVGYSVNDVILKYLVDAITAERNSRHRTPEKKPLPIYAFSGIKDDKRDQDTKEWELKGITSIPYTVVGGSHKELSDVLAAWANYHETGRMEKGAIVRGALKSLPDSVSEIGRRTIKRVIWALKDPVGCAELPFGDGISNTTAKWIEYIPFELIQGRTRHAIVAWVGAHNGFVESLQWCIKNERYFDDEGIKTLLHSLPGKNTKLEELWRLFLAGHHRRVFCDYSQWVEKRKKIGVLTPGLRREFKELVQPELLVTAEDKSWYSVSNTLRRYFDWYVMIDHSLGYLDAEDASQYLAELMPEMTVALVETCEILKEFDGYDFSYLHISSLYDQQESATGSYDWYQLLVLMKYGLIGLEKQSDRHAKQIVEMWMVHDYPAFYRIVLWGVSALTDYSIDVVVDWLASHEQALWEESCFPELLGLIRVAFHGLSDDASKKIQRMILSPSGSFKPTAREQATRLEHLKSAGLTLWPESESFLKTISEHDSGWASRDRACDGLRVIDHGVFEPSTNVCCDTLSFEVPVSLCDAKSYFDDWMKNKDKCSFTKLFSDWVVKDNNLSLVFKLGVKLNYWSATLWDIALEVTRYDGRIKTATSVLTDDTAASIPVELMSAVAVKLGFWLQATAKNHIRSTAIFSLCKRFLLEVPAKEPVPGTRNSEAPYGLVMETLLRYWFDGEPRIGSRIEEPYRGLFSQIAEGDSLGLKYARRTLLQQIGSFFAVDAEWTKGNLVPLLSWSNRKDAAQESWENAVLSNRYEPKLLEFIWIDFEVAINRYSEFGEMGRKGLVDLLVCHALRSVKATAKKLCTKALENLPDKGLENASLNIYERLTFKGNNHDGVWRNEVAPFLKNIWPGDKKYRNADVFCHLADGILSLDECFAEAVDGLKGFARSDNCHMTFGHVLESGIKGGASHCTLHPHASLKLLSYIGDFSNFPVASLRNCLDQIRAATNNAADVISSTEFKRLSDLVAEKSNDW